MARSRKCELRVHATPSSTINSEKAARRTGLFEEIVFRHVQRLRLGHVRAPELEYKEVQMQQEDLAHHFPAPHESVRDTPLALFDQMPHFLNDLLLLPHSAARPQQF